ncbi:MAG TPA: hypothetical protein VF103_14250 [Polyangiaceae bacterium]
MRGRPYLGLLAGLTVSAVAAHARAQTAALDYSATAPKPVDLRSASAPGETPVRKQATGKGFIFHPSPTDLYAFRFAIGAFYDTIDPAVMYDFKFRFPQLTLDARYGLGGGWSVKGHLNTMFVTNELLFGVGDSWLFGKWSLEADASVGVYLGKLGQFGFDAAFVSPEYRPELTLGYDMGDVALSLRGSLLLMGPERVRVGDTWAGLDNSNFFAGHSEMLYVENTTRSNSIWYFGLGALTTRAYYALWILFPDSPGLFTYPRIVAGYEF